MGVGVASCNKKMGVLTFNTWGEEERDLQSVPARRGGELNRPVQLV